jgi:hypothetical protein
MSPAFGSFDGSKERAEPVDPGLRVVGFLGQTRLVARRPTSVETQR